MKEGGEYPEMFDSIKLIYASLMVIFVYFAFFVLSMYIRCIIIFVRMK